MRGREKELTGRHRFRVQDVGEAETDRAYWLVLQVEVVERWGYGDTTYKWRDANVTDLAFVGESKP